MTISATLSFRDMTIGGISFGLTPETALAYFQAKGLKMTFSWMDIVKEQHASAFTVAKMMDLDLLADTQKAMTEAIAEGRSFEWFKENLIPKLQDKGWWGKQLATDPLTGITKEAQLGSVARLATIFRTNMQVAYATGTWQEIERQKDIAPFLLYDAVDDYRTRPEHAALNGLVIPADDPWWDVYAPPNGFQCRCSVIQLTQAQMERVQKAAGKLPKPDPTPKITRKPWTNPRTGKTSMEPDDIDLGWGFNPGKVGLKNQVDLLAEKIHAMPKDWHAAITKSLQAAAAAAAATQAQAAAVAAQQALAKAEGQDYLARAVAAAQAKADAETAIKAAKDAQVAAGKQMAAEALARAQEKAAIVSADQAAQNTIDAIVTGGAPDPGGFLADAHKKLAAGHPDWASKDPQAKLADIQNLAAVNKAKWEQQTILSGAKKQLLLDKLPTPKQQAVLDNLPLDELDAWNAKIQPDLDQMAKWKALMVADTGTTPTKAEKEAFIKLKKAEKAAAVQWLEAKVAASKAAPSAPATPAPGPAVTIPPLDADGKMYAAITALDGTPPSQGFLDYWKGLSNVQKANNMALYSTSYATGGHGDIQDLFEFFALYQTKNIKYPDPSEVKGFIGLADKKEFLKAFKASITPQDAQDQQDFLSLFTTTGQAPTAPTSAPAPAPSPAAIIDNADAIEDWTGVKLTKYAAQQGSNRGGFYHDDGGDKFYIKYPASEDIARNEVLAAKLYQLAGVEVPELSLIRTADGIGVASRIVGGVTKQPDLLKAGGVAGAEEYLAIDAWLANWDVVGLGYDNLLVAGGRAIRIDVGGSLRYRAQGGLKGAAWGDTPGELETLLDASKNPNSAALFKNATQDQIIAGVRKILAVPNAALVRAVEVYGPTDGVERAELLRVLKARRQALVDRFPEALTPAQKFQGPDADIMLRQDELDQVRAARGNGYTRRTDKDMIEDQHVLIWEEGPAKGQVTHTGAQFKVLREGQEAMKRLLPAGAGPAPRTPFPDQVAMSDAFVMLIKGVKNNPVVRIKEIKRAETALQKYTEWMQAMNAARIHATPQSQAAFDKALLYWDDLATKARVIRNTPEGQPQPVFFGNDHVKPQTIPWTPPGQAQAPADAFQLVQKQGFYEAKESQAGWLIQKPGDEKVVFRHTGATYEDFFEGEIDGVRVRYWPPTSDTSMALQGKVEIMTKATGQAAADKIKEVMEKLGLDTSRPEPEDVEQRYLAQIAYSSGVDQTVIDAALAAGTQPERIKALAKAIELELGQDVTKLPHYRPEGRDRAFGHWQPTYDRPDLHSPEVNDFIAKHRIAHNVSGDIAVFYKSLFEQGGIMGGKIDMFRRGLDFQAHGMSPLSDMQRGGGHYVYTKVVPKGSTNQGFSWDADFLRRVDVRANQSDPVGRIDPYYRTPITTQSIKNGDVHSRFYEFIFKNGLSIFDNNFKIRTSGEAQRQSLIAWTKAQGQPFAQGLWPDGRTLEQVIL